MPSCALREVRHCHHPLISNAVVDTLLSTYVDLSGKDLARLGAPRGMAVPLAAAGIVCSVSCIPGVSILRL